MKIAYLRSKYPLAGLSLSLASALAAVVGTGCDAGLPERCDLDFSTLVQSNFGQSELDALLEVSAKAG